MAASRRPIVEGLAPRLASAAKKAATVSGAAGRAGTRFVSHQEQKSAKSDWYARLVAAAFSARAYPTASSSSGPSVAGSAPASAIRRLREGELSVDLGSGPIKYVADQMTG